MRRRSGIRRVLKWLGTLLCVLIAFAFFYSTRRTVYWTSPGLSQADLMLGAVGYGWIRDDAPLEDWKYPPRPGWGHGRLGGSPKLYWWIVSGGNKYCRWVIVPLWMPFVVLSIPTTVLWYRDRKSIPEALRRFSVWMTPRWPKKVTFWRVVLFCVIHIAALFSGLFIFEKTYNFFVEHPSDHPVYPIVELLVVILFWSTPLWAVLWAWLWTRLLNWLFRRQPGQRCRTCGYDLTGNVSGRCPECGTQLAADAE